MRMSCKAALIYVLGCLLSATFPLWAADKPNEATPSAEEWLVVHAGRLLAIPGSKSAHSSTVVIKDGRITDVLEGYVAVETVIPRGVKFRYLDLKNSFVLPGLMDMHVHLSFEFDVDGQMNHGGAEEYLEMHQSTERDVYAMVNAIVNARKTLLAGFTTVRNVGGNGWHIFALRDAIEDGNLVGPRIFAAGHTIRIGADSGPGACTSVESCRRATREQIDMGADLIKVYATCSGSKSCGHENAPSVFLGDEFKAVVETAKSRELKVAAHAHGTAGLNLAVAAGVDSIEHGSFNDAKSRKSMRRNKTFLVPTLAVQDNILRDIEGATGSMHSVMQNFLDNHGPRMFAAHKAGVRIAAGSDAGVTVHGNNARELEMYVKYGLTPMEAIVTATVNAAELVGKSAELGTIEVGKIADLIAVQGNPVEDISVLTQVTTVISNGRVIKEEEN